MLMRYKQPAGIHSHHLPTTTNPAIHSCNWKPNLKMAASKPDLSRAGTMEVTAKEGTTFLDKNLTEWKKPYLMPDGETIEEDGEEEAEEEEAAPNPPTKKARLSKATTMVGTAKEAKTLLAGEKLADTRQETKLAKQRRASKLKRASTMAKTKLEAEAVYGGDLDLSEGRTLRKRPASKEEPKKPAMKKAGTMQVTAKEGKAYLKRTPSPKKGKAKGKGKGKK